MLYILIYNSKLNFETTVIVDAHFLPHVIVWKNVKNLSTWNKVDSILFKKTTIRQNIK